MTNRDRMYRKKGRALFLSAIMVLSVVALSSAFAGSAAAAVDQQNTERIISNTEVTNGTTVTVTVNGAFDATIDDAKLVDNINGQGISADNVTITDADGGFSAVTSDPAVDVTYNDDLNFGLGSDSFTVEYEVTIPEDTPVGTTITFNGNVTDNSDGDTAAIGGNTQIEVVEQPPPTATVEFTDQTVQNGSTSVNVAGATFNGTESFNIVVHQASDDNDDGTIQAGEIGTKIGESAELNSGTQTDISVNISKQVDPDDDVSQLTESQTLVAMLHTTNTNDGDNIVHTAPITRDNTPVFNQAEITVQQQQGIVETDTLPSIIESGSSLGQQSATFNNTRNEPIEDVSLVIVNNDNGDNIQNVSQNVDIPVGESQTVTFEAGEINVDPGTDVTAELRADGITVVGPISVTVTDPDDTGAITGNIRTLAGGPVQNVQELNISIIRLQDGREVTGDPANSPVQPDANGEYTVEVPVDGGETDYRVEVDQPRFAEFSRQVGVADGATERIDIRLDSAAAKVGVGLFDSEQQEIVGDAAALLANGEFDGPVQLAVYAQAQNASGSSVSTRPAPPETTVDLTVDDIDNSDNLESLLNQQLDSDEGTFLNPSDADDSQRTLSIELNDGVISANSVDTNVDAGATISGSNGFDPDGDVSLGVFNVTSGNVTRDDINALENAVAQGDIRASIDEEDTVDGSINDTSDLIYFIEGEKSTQHQVLDTDGDPIENATVFISYEGAPQNLEDVENFQNDAGESFLTAQSNENGIAVVSGLVPDVTYNVYVNQSGFNIFNSSTADANGQFLDEETNIDPKSFVADYTLNQTITIDDQDADGSGFSEVYAHTLRERPQEFRLNVTIADGDSTQVKSALVPPGGNRDVQVNVAARPIDAVSGTPFEPFAGQDVTLELTNRTAGGLGGSTITSEVTVTTNENGIATTAFGSSVRRSQNTNVTANTTNANGVLFETDSFRGQNLNNDSDQAEINVAGTLTGDVRDRDEELIRNRVVNVTLVKDGNTSRSRTIDQGQYNFENLETGESYRVIAEFQNESGVNKSGFATVDSLQPGTNTRDIVVQDADISNSNSTNSPLDQPAAEYDTDGDGNIDIGELAQAGEDFASGELPISDLADIGQVFAS
uniref:EF-hand domain-containing protein n=1 Tax=uncultured haloarchaeon TaxID=160804 RepID=A0A0K1YBS6_9EURY|nr:hypothetical protein [uncultured haloarchaeon]